VGRRIIKSRIKTQPRDHTGTWQCLDLVKQFEHRKTAVCYTDDLPARQPAPEEPDHLPCPCRQALMAAASLLIEALRGTQGRHKGQRPDAVSAGEGSQEHTREPAQATGFDHMGMRGPYGVAVDAFGGNLLAPAAFDGVIQTKDNDTTGDKHGDEE